MNIELKAQTTDAELLFEYTGRQLVKPLKALIRWQTFQITATEKALDKAIKARDDKPPPKVGSLPQMPEHMRIEAKLRALCIERDDAKLWKSECERVPTAVYKLTMVQLKRLYRHQLDPRSEAKS